MGNTHLKEDTREQLNALMKPSQSFDDVVVVLLAEHKLLEVVLRENELLREKGRCKK